jgi:hypothetical protein
MNKAFEKALIDQLRKDKVKSTEFVSGHVLFNAIRDLQCMFCKEVALAANNIRGKQWEWYGLTYIEEIKQTEEYVREELNKLKEEEGVHKGNNAGEIDVNTAQYFASARKSIELAKSSKVQIISRKMKDIRNSLKDQETQEEERRKLKSTVNLMNGLCFLDSVKIEDITYSAGFEIHFNRGNLQIYADNVQLLENMPIFRLILSRSCFNLDRDKLVPRDNLSLLATAYHLMLGNYNSFGISMHS